MANPRKPDTVHRLQGTWRPDRHALKHSSLPAKAPDKPSTLDPEASVLWDHYSRLLNRAGMLTETDQSALEHFVTLHAEWRRDPGSFTAAKQALLRTLRSDLGMTPASRDRIPRGQTEVEENEFACFLPGGEYGSPAA